MRSGINGLGVGSGITASGSGITTLGIGISSVFVESGIKIVNIFGIRDQNSQCFCDQGLKFSTFLWSGIKIWGKNTGSVMKKKIPCYDPDPFLCLHPQVIPELAQFWPSLCHTELNIIPLWVKRLGFCREQTEQPCDTKSGIYIWAKGGDEHSPSLKSIPSLVLGCLRLEIIAGDTLVLIFE